MNLNIIKELAKKQLATRKERSIRERGYTYGHGERVAALAILLRKKLSFENTYDDIIKVACWFHDISKGTEPHGQYGAIVTKELLGDHVNEGDLEKISEIIKFHQVRLKDNSYPDYVRLVQDADMLDHFGHIGIWITSYENAAADKTVEDLINHYDDNFIAKVKKMRDLLNYDISKKIFDDKIHRSLTFINNLKVEVDGGIIEETNDARKIGRKDEKNI